MAIYRGPGGAGDATVDATNAAAEVALKTQEAVDAATAAAASAAEAAASAVIASTGLSGIAAYAAAAAGSAADASDSADAAAISESNANEDAGTASTKANEASASAAAAASSASAAASSAAAAFSNETASASSAASAADDADAAAASAASASTSAGNAAISEANAAAYASAASSPPATPITYGTLFGRTDTGTYTPPTALTGIGFGFWFSNPSAYSIYSDLAGDYNGPGAPGDINTAVSNGTIQVGQPLTLICTRLSTGLQETVPMGNVVSITTGGIGAVTITGTNAINWSLYADSGVWFGYKLIVHQLVVSGVVAENVTLGKDAGIGITTGGENVLIGAAAGNNVGSGRNNVVIGNASSASAQNVSNEVTLGNSNHTKTRLFGALAMGGSSVGTSGQVLTSQGSGAAPIWSNAGGTVTSVALSVPTGLTVSGSPVTTSGTLALSYTTGYSIPTTASQTNWDTSYGWGNHASAGYLTSATAASTYAPLTGTGTSGTWGISITGNAATVTNGLYSTSTYSNPTWLTSISGSIVSGNISGNAANVTGTVAIANGGTGQTTQQAAINALTGTQSSGKYLRSDGTNASLSTIQAADVPTLNQNTTGTAANITATSNSTLTTLSALSLPGSQVSGNISGNAANVTGTVAVANGGSGQTTAQAAMNAFAGAVTSGSYLRGNGTNVVMSTIQAADVPTLNQNTTGTASNVTGTVAVANGGTGSTTLTANNVLLGNGTSALQAVAPGTSGNVLTSNGTTWVSSAASGGASAATATALGTVYGKTDASSQTFLGYNAGAQSPTYTVAVGFEAGTAATSTVTTYGATFVGYRAGKANTTGKDNTFLGNFSGAATTTSSNNTGVGGGSLFSNTTGANNTAVGLEALKANTTASNNTAVGYQAGYSNIAGVGNTFVGTQAGYSHNTAGNTYNTFIGYYAGYSTTGSFNTFLGEESGYAITSGAKNTILGRYSGNQGGLDIRTANNNVVLSDGDGNVKNWYDSLRGYWGTTTNIVSCIYNFVGDYNAYRGIGVQSSSAAGGDMIMFYASTSQAGRIVSTSSSTTYNTSSDYRLKENVQPMTGALEKVALLKPCTYTWKIDGSAGQGFIAHELQEVVPDAVSGVKDAVHEDGSIDPQGIDTSFLVATLTAAIQELKADLDATKAELAALKGAQA